MNADKKNPGNLAIQIATLLGVGYVPGAPGTLGSLIGLMLYVLVFLIGGAQGVVIVFAWVLVFSIWSSGLASQQLHQKDPSCIVIDEVVGLWVTLMGTQSHGPMLLVGFLLFRFFDVLKPFPIRRVESLPKGWGIVLDDVLAGIYANLSLRILLRVLHS